MPSPRPTKVILTVDTECTEERLVQGNVRPPLGFGPMIWGELGWGRPLGIPFIVEELAARGMQATFYLEALCTLHFGESGLKEVVAYLLEAGQDIQLHLHPNFERPEWRASGQPAPEDNIGRLPYSEQVRLLRAGCDILARCGLSSHMITGFRAGNYGASNDTLRALSEVGFVLDASYNPCYLSRDCDLSFDGASNDVFHDPAGVWELPVTNFIQPGGAFRHLEITAISVREMTWALRALRRAGASCVSIVTHPAEFFSIDPVSPVRGRPNWVNVIRFRRLLDFLASNADQFSVTTAGALAAELRDGTHLAKPQVPYPRGRALMLGERLAEQVVKRIDMKTGMLARLLG